MDEGRDRRREDAEDGRGDDEELHGLRRLLLRRYEPYGLHHRPPDPAERHEQQRDDDDEEPEADDAVLREELQVVVVYVDTSDHLYLPQLLVRHVL